MNIIEMIKNDAPNIRKEFKAGTMYYVGHYYPTNERVRIDASGAITFVIDSGIGEFYMRGLETYNVPFKIDQGRYARFSAKELRKAGMIR